MKKILLASVLCILIFSIGAAGCIGSEPIVGDWFVYGTEIPVVFNNDGTGTMTISLFGITSTVPMTWEKVDEKTYKLTGTSELFNAGTYKLSDDGKSLEEVSSGLKVFVKKA